MSDGGTHNAATCGGCANNRAADCAYAPQLRSSATYGERRWREVVGTLVGTPQATYGATAAASVSHSYGTAVQAGDVALVAVAGYHDTATITSVISSVAGTVTQVGTLLRTSAAPDNEALLDVYVIVFSAAGTPTFTANYSTSVADRSIRSIVWRGIDTTTPVEATAGAVQNTDTPSATTGNIVQGNPGPIVVFLNEWGWAANHNHAVGTPSTGWTEWGDTATGGDNKYQNFTDTGTRTGQFSWTDTGSNDFSVVRGVALRDEAVAGLLLYQNPMRALLVR